MDGSLSKSSVEKIEWGGWPNCYRITDGRVEAILTSDVGPRILHFGFVGSQNVLLEIPNELGKSGEPHFVARGGHRLWIAPEHKDGSYSPDNQPCRVLVENDALELTGPIEPATRLRKQLRIRLDETGSLEVVHRLQNTGSWNVKASIWALTMMAPGGHGITGFPPRGTHPECLAPTNPLVMWAFTDLSDPRLCFTPKHLVLRQDPQANKPFKLGHFNEDTWGAYLLGSDLFVKRCTAIPGVAYPDYGCSFEIWTNAGTLELEILSPLTEIEPDGWLEHTEHWSLHQADPVKEWTDEAIITLMIGK